jgi:sugar/nucleoside kinase (ribokinase family)
VAVLQGKVGADALRFASAAASICVQVGARKAPPVLRSTWLAECSLT